MDGNADGETHSVHESTISNQAPQHIYMSLAPRPTSQQQQHPLRCCKSFQLPNDPPSTYLIEIVYLYSRIQCGKTVSARDPLNSFSHRPKANVYKEFSQFIRWIRKLLQLFRYYSSDFVSIDFSLKLFRFGSPIYPFPVRGCCSR